MEERATGRVRESQGGLREERPRGSRKTKRDRGERGHQDPQEAEAREGTRVCRGEKAIEGRTKQGTEGTRKWVKRGREKENGEGAIPHSGLEDHRIREIRGDCMPVRVPRGILSTDSSCPLLFSGSWLFRDLPSPGWGRLFYLFLLSADPSSPNSRPDQAALPWAEGRLHLPLVIFFFSASKRKG